MKYLGILGIVALVLSTSTGCAVFESGGNAMKDSLKMFRPRPFDSAPDSDPMAADDEWDFVGKEGRGDMPRTRDPDRWWQDLVRSERAESIERNLGID